MTHNIVRGQEAKEALLAAINLLGSSVEATLGPNARTVLVQQEGRPPTVLNDGVKIVSSVKSSDPAIQAGIEMFRQVALEAQQASGDGTTTATIIAQALCNEYIGWSENPVDDAEDLLAGLDSVVKGLNDMSKKINLKDTDPALLEEEHNKLLNVATIAANNDQEIGMLLRDMFVDIGSEGLVNLKVGSQDTTYWERTTGCEIPTSYVSPMLCNTKQRTFEHDSPLFIITKEIIEDFDDLTPALEVAIENNRPLVIICQDIKGVALSNLIANVVGGVVKACAVRIPRTDPEEWFEDIQALVGGNIFFSSENGTGIVNAVAGKQQFGSAERVTISPNSMVIVAGFETPLLDAHLDGLDCQLNDADHPFLREKLLTRTARLDSKMASIYIGGFTDAEIRETRERIDDAVNATRLAFKDGVVVGGGWSLNTLSKITSLPKPFVAALKRPLEALVHNGKVGGGLIWGEEYYLNTKTGEMEHIDRAVVLDPTSVVINSLKAAVSIARLMILTDSIILKEPNTL